MWLIVNTDSFNEQRSIDLLNEHYPDVIADVYFPLSRREYVDQKGEKRVRFQPLLHGMFFIKVKDIRCLRHILSPYGYFIYRGIGYDAVKSQYVEHQFFAKAHLLCPDCRDKSVDEIIYYAIIPESDMERFIFYSERLADGIKGLTVVEHRYEELIEENDTVRILNGPMEGWVGVVKQVKRGGKKDRHFMVRFGDNLCLNISNIRQWDMRVEREATKGAKSEAVGVWRAIDQLIGYFQVHNPEKNASEELRKLLRDYHQCGTVRRDPGISDVAFAKKKGRAEKTYKESILQRVDSAMHGNFRILADFFHADRSTIDSALLRLIPDMPLRPLLTPTSGCSIPEGEEYAAFVHNGLVEIVVRCNLRHYFRDCDYDADRYTPIFDEDYDYYVHIALLPTADGHVRAITSWGGFYDSYVSMNELERNRLLRDFSLRGYPHMLRLLGSVDVLFEKHCDIGGFTICLDIPYATDIQSMAAEALRLLTSPLSDITVTSETESFLSLQTSAAVEMWQGTRLLFWRQLLQRYVLLHKVPIADMPMVIQEDTMLEQVLMTDNGIPDIPVISAALSQRTAQVHSRLQSGELTQAVLMFLQVSKSLSCHFAKDGHYNYISSEGYNPDQTLTTLFCDISSTLSHVASQKTNAAIMQHIEKLMTKGIVELKTMDSWTYFKFPSWVTMK